MIWRRVDELRHSIYLVLFIIFFLMSSVHAEIVKNGGASAGLSRPLSFVRPSAGQIPTTLGSISYKGSGPVFHGGLVSCHTLHVSIIYYGASWPARAQEQNIVDGFLTSLSNTPYLNTLAGYTSGFCSDPARTIAIVKTDVDTGSLGTTPTLGALGDLIERRVNSAQYPKITDFYIIVGTPDVSVTYGMNYSCNSPQAVGANSCFCGIHTWQPNVAAGQSRFRYTFITTGLSNCQAQTGKSPNGNVDADAAVNVIAHEMAEAITDGYQGTINGGLVVEGYNDPNDGSEIGDMCNFYFPRVYASANGSMANIHVGSNDYLIQAIWKLGQGCAMN